MPEPSLRPERVDGTRSLAVPEEIAHYCFGETCVDLVGRYRRTRLASLSNCGRFISYQPIVSRPGSIC